jgi:tetratricopeptide (TPR) repeat protein
MFKHALTQEVAYHSVLSERRRALHERAGAALEQLAGERVDEHLDELAHHYERSANLDKAGHYLSLTAHRTAQQGLLAEGSAQAERALKLIESLPETPERAERELELLIPLVLATYFGRGPAAAETVRFWERATTLGRRVGENRKLFSILTVVCSGRADRGELASADALREEINAVAGKTNEIGYVSAASVIDAWITLWVGRFSQASAYAERSVAEYDRGGQAISAWLLWPDVLGLHTAGLALWPLGYPDRALSRAEEALARARSLDPINLACGLHVIAEVCAHRGEFARACAAARDEVEVCTRYGIGGGSYGGKGAAIGTLGWVLVLRGELAEGLAQLRSGIEEMDSRGRKLFIPAYLGRQATGYLAAGDARAASDAIAGAISLASETGERIWAAELRRIEGAIALKQGTTDEAERAFRDALEIAQAQEAKSWELRAANSLARTLAGQGRREEAHALLASVYGWFREGFDTADLREAKSLMEQLEQEAG